MRRGRAPPRTRAGRAAGVLLTALVALLLCVPAALAQADEPSLVLEPITQEARVERGGSVVLEWTVFNPDPDLEYLLLNAVEGPGSSNWQATVAPDSIVIGPGDTRTIRVTVEADHRPAPQDADFTLRVRAVQDTTHVDLMAHGRVSVVSTNLVLGQWDNPLPAPLDGPGGTFLLDVAFWTSAALVLALGIRPLVRLFTRKTETKLDDRAARILGLPLFLLLVAYGTKQSMEVFAWPSAVVDTIDHAFLILFIIVVTYVVWHLWSEIILVLGEVVTKRSENELDDKLYPVFQKIGGLLIGIGGLFFIVNSFGVNLTYFAAGGVLISMVIAFAAQETLANFFAGIFILLDQPFRVGDRIELGEQQTWGDVVEIGLRSTRVRTRDNRMVIVPNASIGSNPIVNHTYPDPTFRIGTMIGVAYGTRIDHARRVLTDAARSIEGAEPDRTPDVLVREFGDSSIVFEVRVWMRSFNDKFRVLDRLNTAIYDALARNNIEIPFPQRVIWDGRREADARTGTNVRTEADEDATWRIEDLDTPS